MKIGLFSDTYLPTLNGISYVLQIMQKNLEELGHEVYIFAPATNLRGIEAGDNEHVFRFPAIEGIFFDEQLTSVFFPRSAMKKIKNLNLDIVHFFTPSQIGLMGVYTAIREDIPLINQYSTDLYQYVERYPNVLPGTIALSLMAPFFLKLTPREFIKMMSAFKPKRDITKWHKEVVANMHVTLHDQCDAVIALSRKMQNQLDSWGSKTHATLLPTGVDPLPEPSQQEIKSFREQYGIKANEKVILNAGRMSREKNLDVLLDAFIKYIAPKYKNIKLMLAGNFDYREVLETRANKSEYGDRVIFTGAYKREEAGVIYKSAAIFAFPSLTDTQGIVLHEATGAGLPLVLCDKDVSEVFVDNQTGLLAKNQPKDFAEKIMIILNDKKLYSSFSNNAKKRAAEFGELDQMKKLEELYQKCINEHKKINFAGSSW